MHTHHGMDPSEAPQEHHVSIAFSQACRLLTTKPSHENITRQSWTVAQKNNSVEGALDKLIPLSKRVYMLIMISG